MDNNVENLEFYIARKFTYLLGRSYLSANSKRTSSNHSHLILPGAAFSAFPLYFLRRSQFFHPFLLTSLHMEVMCDRPPQYALPREERLYESLGAAGAAWSAQA
jgi:hypothetical protein